MNSTRLFHEFASWVCAERTQPTFKEFVLQHEFVRTLQATVWAGLASGRLKPSNARTADIVLYDRRMGNVCVAVELKNAGELTPAHRDQARRYSEEHNAPCVLTNGLEYRVILSRRAEGDFSHEGIVGRRTNSQSMDIQLGEIDPRRYHGALEGQLQELFAAAMQGEREVNQVLGRLSKGTAFDTPRNVFGDARKERMISGKVDERTKSANEPDFGALFTNERGTPKQAKRIDEVGHALKQLADSFPPPVPAFKTNSALSVARALKRELKGMPLTISEDSNERATICLDRLQIVRVTEFQLHCRISIRQPDDKAARGTEVTGKGWRTDTIASRDIESIQAAAALVRKLWNT